jgi:signal transduction histidine kinase
MPQGHWVVLHVTDTGPGMPGDALEHLFEPFYTTKGITERAGLGLAQVYGIMRQHGGYISVESREGEGTTFKLYFPALAVQQDS